MVDSSALKKERRVKISDIVFIVVLLLGPGIRGYNNWKWYEYAFIAALIGSIVYAWITGNRFWKGREKKAKRQEKESLVKPGIVFSLLLILVLCSGCGMTGNLPEQDPAATMDAETAASQPPTLMASAEGTMMVFYRLLNEGEYHQAVPLYGGSYEVLQSWNPDTDPKEFAELFQMACEFNGLMCLKVLDIVSITPQDEHDFLFEVEFANPDGSTFVRGPCCGATEEEMPSESAFLVEVNCADDGTCRVMTLPPYVP